MEIEEVPCVEFVELTTDYREGGLDPDLRALFEEHAVSCYPCSTYRTQVEQTIAAVRGLRTGPPDPEVKERVLRRLDVRSDDDEWSGERLLAAPAEPSRLRPAMNGESGERVYKFLKHGRVSPFAGSTWEPAEEGRPGAWEEVEGALAMCANGIHACRAEQLPYWLDEELWVVEVTGVALEDHRKLVARRARLVRRIEAWTPRMARRFAHACTLRARRHAAFALRRGGRHDEAARLMSSRSFARIRSVGAALADVDASCGYAADVAEIGVLPKLHALTADMAAYTAAVVADSADAYAAERAWQAQWLIRRLGLPVSG
jgi:hypothetical protein